MYVVLTEDDAKLRSVGGTGRQDLPVAGLEFFGDRAVTSEGDLVSRSGDRAELESGEAEVSRSGNLQSSVHAGGLSGLRLRHGIGVIDRLGFRLGFLALPP